MILKRISMLAVVYLLVTWAPGPQGVLAEKLSVILPGQNTEFNIDNGHVDFDIRSTGGVGLSLPAPPSGGIATPRSPQSVQDAPPATVPTSPPGLKGSSIFGNGAGVPIQSSKPTINALYDVPDIGPIEQQGACQAATVIITSTATVTSTRVSLSQVAVPTTVFQDRVVTSTSLRYQTNFQTSYVTVQAPPQTSFQTRTVTSQVVRSQTIYSTTTELQRQYFTTTLVDYQTQVVTRPVTREVTVTSLNTQYVSIPVTSTLVRTQVVTSRIAEATYITVTSTQPNTCSSSTTDGYSYPVPAGGSTSYGGSSSTGPESSYGSGYYGSNGGSEGYYGGNSGPTGYYGVGYYGNGYRRPGRYTNWNKGLFGKWF